MTGTDWPYDADRDDPLTALRIPVTSAYPGFTYTACFDRRSEVRPTDAEASMIASFIEEYQERWFGQGRWRKIQQAKPFDMDCYTTAIFHKWADDDWSYRICTWSAWWSPVAPRLRGTECDDALLKGPLTLVQLMDRAHTVGRDGEPMRHWLEWKAAHPEVFPEAPDGH